MEVGREVAGCRRGGSEGRDDMEVRREVTGCRRGGSGEGH